MFSLLLLSLTAKAEEVDTLGGYDTYNNHGDMLKLVVIDVAESTVLTESDFAVYNNNSSGDVIFTLYVEESDGSFTLLESLDAETPGVTGQPDWASTGPTAWVLEAGKTYAIGVWIASDWYYFYGSSSESPQWGEVLGTFRVEEDSPPQTFSADLEEYYYAMSLTSEDADVDGDGAIDQQWGGDDCDDQDVGKGPGVTEVPYDGIDQDCDGSDLVDADGDGVPAEAAGGEDCDDTVPTIAPGLDDACGDGVDSDCDGADCPATTGGDDDTVTIDAGCGCTTSPAGSPGAIAAIGLAIAGLVRSRRR